MEQPRVAVLGGTGQQGRGLAQRLARASYHVIVGSRDADRAAAVVAGWPAQARPDAIAEYGPAISGADVIVLALPFGSVGQVLVEHQGQFEPESLVIDVTVPVTATAGALTLADVPEGSATQHVRARVPPHTRVAAAFKTVPAHLLGEIDRPLDC